MGQASSAVLCATVTLSGSLPGAAARRHKAGTHAQRAHATLSCLPATCIQGWCLSGCAGVDEVRVLSLAQAAGFPQAEAHVHHLAGNYSAALDCMFRIKAAPGDGFASSHAARVHSSASRDGGSLAQCTLRFRHG